MNKKTKLGLVTAAVITGMTAFGVASYADSDERGDCHWKRGGHHSMMMQHRGGMGFFGGEPRETAYTADEIRTLGEAFLLRRNNPNLKVGDIRKNETGNYLVDITTVDDSLVRTMEIDPMSGLPAKMTERFRRMHDDHREDDDDR